MQRIHFYLPAKLVKQLRKDAQEHGISMAELLRRIMDAHFSK